MSYRTKLSLITEKAKKENLPFVKIEVSPNKKKKFRIHLKDGSHVDMGAAGMEDWLDHKDEARRKRFHSRFRNNVGYNSIHSGLYWSARLLW